MTNVEDPDSFLYTYVDYYHFPTIPTIHNCLRLKSVHLSLPYKCFTFNTIIIIVVAAVWVGQNFKWSKI